MLQKPKSSPCLLFLLLFITIIPHLSLVQATPCESTILGDANGDGRVDIADPISILGYLFGGANEPTCLNLANVNADERVDIADAIYLLSYLFANGPAPKLPFKKPLKINDDATYTNSTTVTLILSTEGIPGRVPFTQMRFSNDNLTWSNPEACVALRSGWRLIPGDGLKTVYVKFKDSLGTWSAAYSDTIILDTQGPSLEITSPKEGEVIR